MSDCFIADPGVNRVILDSHIPAVSCHPVRSYRFLSYFVLNCKAWAM